MTVPVNAVLFILTAPAALARKVLLWMSVKAIFLVPRWDITLRTVSSESEGPMETGPCKNNHQLLRHKLRNGLSGHLSIADLDGKNETCGRIPFATFVLFSMISTKAIAEGAALRKGDSVWELLTVRFRVAALFCSN